MNGYYNALQQQQQQIINEESEDSGTKTKILFMKVEPAYELKNTCGNTPLVRNGPKILNFSLNPEKQRLQEVMKQDPEFVFNRNNGTFLQYYTKDVPTRPKLVTMAPKTEMVSTSTQRFQIKYMEDGVKQHEPQQQQPITSLQTSRPNITKQHPVLKGFAGTTKTTFSHPPTKPIITFVSTSSGSSSTFKPITKQPSSNTPQKANLLPKPLSVKPIKPVVYHQKPKPPVISSAPIQSVLPQQPVLLQSVPRQFATSEPVTPPTVVHRRLYKCLECNAQFVRSYQLNRHQFIAHPNSRISLRNNRPQMVSTSVQTSATRDHALSEPINRVNSNSSAQPIENKPIIQMFKSPIFTNGSIPIRVLPKPEPPPRLQLNPQEVLSSSLPNTTNNILSGNPRNLPSCTSISLTKRFPDPAPKNVSKPINNQPSVTITPRNGPSLSLSKVLPSTNFTTIATAPKPIIVSSGINPLQTVSTSGSAPRIVIRKDTPDIIKFTEATQHEYSQITYEVPLDGSDIRFMCVACEKTFEHISELDVHLQSHNGEPFRYKCELCDDFVMSIPHLRNHVHSHTQYDLPIKCDQCECRFIDQPAVYRHACLQQIAPVCYPCRQTFLTDSLLRSHQFVHTKVKPYKCGSCNEHFIHLSSLTKHQEHETSCGSLNILSTYNRTS